MQSWVNQFQKYKLSIVVPVFNEADHLIQNLDTLLDEVEGYFPNFEIIVVSDGSTDGTNLKLHSFRHRDVRPIILAENAGKGGAVRAGFEQASGDYILFIDGGMEIHPKEIRIFMGLMALYQTDIVIGSKRHPQSRIYYPWYRRSLSWLFQRIVRTLFKIDVTDTQVGIKLFRREVVEAVLPHLQIDRYGFDLEILSLAKAFGYGNVLEAPIRMDYFMTNERFVLTEIFHVLRIGVSLLRDTLTLFWRVRKIRSTKPPLKQDLPERRVG